MAILRSLKNYFVGVVREHLFSSDLFMQIIKIINKDRKRKNISRIWVFHAQKSEYVQRKTYYTWSDNLTHLFYIVVLFNFNPSHKNDDYGQSYSLQQDEDHKCKIKNVRILKKRNCCLYTMYVCNVKQQSTYFYFILLLD